MSKRSLLIIFTIIALVLSEFIIFTIFKKKEYKKVPVDEKIVKKRSPTPNKIEPLTLEKIFFGEKSYLKNLPQEKLITIISTGDIIPARMVNMRAIQHNDFTWSYKNVWEILKNADLTVANFESPIFESCSPTSEGMTFCGKNKHIEGLTLAGIDLVSLANNHVDNYGQTGINETTKLLSKSGIKFTGLNETVYLTIKNIRFAFLGFNFLYPFSETETVNQIKNAKENSDIVAVMPHWGSEYQEIPDAFETNMNKILLENGASLILGNHPHIIQPIAIDNEKLTFFAHGNFIFDQEWSEETKKGFIAKTYIFDGKIIDVEILPIYIKDFGQPEIVEGEKKEKMIKDLYELSSRYKNL